MDVNKELIRHTKEIVKINNKYYSRFQAAYDQAIDAKARNLRSLDKIAADNVVLDKQMSELGAAISLTTNIE